MNMTSGPKQNNLTWDEVFNIENEEELIAHKAHVLGAQFMHFVDKAAAAKGLSRKELAKKVNTSASYITQLMRGDKLPNMEILARFCKALQFEFDISSSLPDEYEQSMNEAFNRHALELRKHNAACKVLAMNPVRENVNMYEEDNLLINVALNYEDTAIPA